MEEEAEEEDPAEEVEAGVAEGEAEATTMEVAATMEVN